MLGDAQSVVALILGVKVTGYMSYNISQINVVLITSHTIKREGIIADLIIFHGSSFVWLQQGAPACQAPY
jgi:hypothetical protein